MLTTYHLFYDNIDFKKNMGRVENMSNMMANITQHITNEVAYQTVTYDFTLPTESRTLFPYIK